MHPVFQSFKRAYWSSMRFQRDWTGELGITPARLDMLVAIAHCGGHVQKNLRRVLDVTSPVVSRMLESLEKLGLVYRVRCPTDRRTYSIMLTDAGRQLLTIACVELLYDGYTELCVKHVVSPAPHSRRATRRAFARTNADLLRLRARVTDVSTLHYPTYLRSGNRSPDHPAPLAWPPPRRRRGRRPQEVRYPPSSPPNGNSVAP